MKRYITLLCLLAAMLCLSSCITEEANYYVKYEATITSIYYGAEVNYVVATEKGSQTITTDSKNLSEVFGPVQKGFTASISGKSDYPPVNSSMVVNIYVCRGEEPFALKAQDVSKENSYSDTGISASASYTIDF